MNKSFINDRRLIKYFVTNDERFKGESNLSFIRRISWKYNLPPSTFISREILQVTGNPVDLNFSVATFCNSVTSKSQNTQERLYELTGIDRSLGSYAYLDGFLDPYAHGVIAKHKKWCPFCYSERTGFTLNCENETPIFDDLYWSLELSRYCVKHKVRLSDRCGHCYVKQPYISFNREPGFCHSCGKSLTYSPCVDYREDEEQLDEISQELDFLSIFHSPTNPNIFKTYTMGNIVANLKTLADGLGRDGHNILSSAIGISRDTLLDWLAEKHLISLESFLIMGKGLGLKSLSFLFKNPLVFEWYVGKNIQQQFNFRFRAEQINKVDEISRYIQKIIKGNEPPVCRDSIAHKFGVSKGMIEQHFSDQLRQVSTIYKAYKKAKNKDKENELYKDIFKTVVKCYQSNGSWDLTCVIENMSSDPELYSPKYIYETFQKVSSKFRARLKEK